MVGENCCIRLQAGVDRRLGGFGSGGLIFKWTDVTRSGEAKACDSRRVEGFRIRASPSLHVWVD
jgi:hypothetical protein